MQSTQLMNSVLSNSENKRCCWTQQQHRRKLFAIFKCPVFPYTRLFGSAIPWVFLSALSFLCTKALENHNRAVCVSATCSRHYYNHQITFIHIFLIFPSMKNTFTIPLKAKRHFLHLLVHVQRHVGHHLLPLVLRSPQLFPQLLLVALQDAVGCLQSLQFRLHH